MNRGTPRSSVRAAGPPRLLVDLSAALTYVAIFGQFDLTPISWMYWSNIASTLVIGALLVLRWRYRWVALAVILVLTSARVSLGWTTDPFVAVAWAAYPVALRTRGPSMRVVRWLVVALLPLVLVLLLLGSSSSEATDNIGYGLVSVMLVGGSWVLARSVREQREQAQSAARAREEAAIVRERVRIARELHDVTSHTLGSIGVQAGVAAYGDLYDEEALRETLRQIEASSRSAIGTDAGLGDSGSHAARSTGVLIMTSNSIGVKRPSAA